MLAELTELYALLVLSVDVIKGARFTQARLPDLLFEEVASFAAMRLRKDMKFKKRCTCSEVATYAFQDADKPHRHISTCISPEGFALYL